jgi:hypothetical protein
MFDEFQKKNKAPKKSRLKFPDMNDDVVITIPLKGGKFKQSELTDDFVKVIEYEYAVKYLEHMGVEPSIKMIAELLKRTPLSSCTMDSGSTNKDFLSIFPKKKNPKTF